MLPNEYTTSVELKRADQMRLDAIGKPALVCHYAAQYLTCKLYVTMTTGYLLPQLDNVQGIRPTQEGPI